MPRLWSARRPAVPVEPAPPQPERSVIDGQKLFRLEEMLSAVLGEVRTLDLDEHALADLRIAQLRAVTELASALPPELGAELGRIQIPGNRPAMTRDELRVVQAQLVGWLEGMLHGLQIAVVVRSLEPSEAGKQGEPAQR